MKIKAIVVIVLIPHKVKKIGQHRGVLPPPLLHVHVTSQRLLERSSSALATSSSRR